MKKLIIPILLFISLLANSQVVKYNLPPKSYYNKANITLKDFKKYECMKVYIKSDSISFIKIYDSEPQSISLSNIDYIRVKSGNQAIAGAGLGALLMGLSALNSVVQYPGYVDSGEFILAFTLSGAALGGLIGLVIPKWKTYYLEY